MFDYIKQIAVFIIAEGVLLNLTINEDYKKYIKLVSGMILVIMVISPLADLTGITGTLRNFFVRITDESEYMQSSMELERLRGYENIEQGRIEAVRKEYEMMLKKQLGNVCMEYGLELLEVEVVFDEEMDDYIGEIELKVDRQVLEESPESIAIKNYITDLYGVEYEKIVISK